MYILECIDKRVMSKQNIRNWYLYEPDDPNFKSEKFNRCFIRNPLNSNWYIGFPAYDKKGIVFQVRRGVWAYTGIIRSIRVVRSRRLSYKRSVVGYRVVTNRLPFKERLRRGIASENEVVSDLYRSRYIPRVFKIHHLLDSGAKCRGVDILLSFFDIDFDSDNYRIDPFNSYVIFGTCGIEVLGVFDRGKRKSNPCFTYYRKDFMAFMDDMRDNGILPVIAWNYKGKTWYMELTPETVKEVFYKRKNGIIGDKQLTNFANVRHTYPYRMTRSQLYGRLCDFMKENRDKYEVS